MRAQESVLGHLFGVLPVLEQLVEGVCPGVFSDITKGFDVGGAFHVGLANEDVNPQGFGSLRIALAGKQSEGDDEGSDQVLPWCHRVIRRVAVLMKFAGFVRIALCAHSLP